MMSAASPVKLSSTHELTKPKHHSYTTQLITLVCNLKNGTGLGAGTCVKILHLMGRLIRSDQRLPCRSTVAVWSRKLANFYQVEPHPDPNTDWVLLLDESITIGGQKVLLLLGIPLKCFTLERPLRFEDCHVLAAPLARSWTGSQIADQIGRLVERGYHFDYALSDQGANLIKAAKLAGLNRVDDCAHYFSTLLRRHYLKRVDFQNFEQQCTQMKRAGTNCGHAHLLPPKHRANSRFLNITPVVDWGIKTIALVHHHAAHELVYPYLDKLAWVVDHVAILNGLNHSVKLIDGLSRMLKTKGYRADTYPEAIRVIDQATSVPLSIRRGLVNYLDRLEEMRGQRQYLLCSTDIVESHFAYLKRKPLHCVGATAEQLVLCHRQVAEQVVRQAMEAQKVVSLYHQAQRRGDPMSVAQKRGILNKLLKEN